MLKKVWTRKKLQQAFYKKSQQMKKHFILRKWHAKTENLTQKRNEINKFEQKKLTKFKYEIYNVIFFFNRNFSLYKRGGGGGLYI